MISKIFLLIIQLLLNYIKYNFLTGSVILSLTILLFIILNINPNFSLAFIQYFPFINARYIDGSFGLGVKEIMQIFSIVTIILMVITVLVRTLLKKIFKLNTTLSLKFKIAVFLVMITSAYSIASVIVAFNDNFDKILYFVFVVFYVVNLISIIGYLFIDILLRRLSQLYK